MHTFPIFSADQQKQNTWKCTVWFAIPMIISGLFTIGLVSFAASCMLAKNNNQEWEATSTTELLQNDTILAYYQNASPVQITADIEKGNPYQFNISLVSTNCDELYIHESQLNVSILVPFSHERPVKIPPDYRHYELGSILNFTVSLISGLNTSELTMNIFSNTLDVDDYISHHTSQSARKRAVFEHQFNSSEPKTVDYEPAVASYYIPTFVAPAGTAVNISYYVTQKYYVFTDYV